MSKGKDLKLNKEEVRQQALIDYLNNEIAALETAIPKKEKMLADFKTQRSDILEMETVDFTEKHPKH